MKEEFELIIKQLNTELNKSKQKKNMINDEKSNDLRKSTGSTINSNYLGLFFEEYNQIIKEEKQSDCLD